MDKSYVKLVFLVVVLVFAAGTQFGAEAIVKKNCQTSNDCLTLGPKCKCLDHFCLCGADEQLNIKKPNILGTQFGAEAIVKKNCQTSNDCLTLGPKCKCLDHFCLCGADEQVLGAQPLIGNP